MACLTIRTSHFTDRCQSATHWEREKCLMTAQHFYRNLVTRELNMNRFNRRTTLLLDCSSLSKVLRRSLIPFRTKDTSALKILLLYIIVKNTLKILKVIFQLKTLFTTLLGTYHEACVMTLCTSFWSRYRISNLKLPTVPHNWMP